MNRKFLFRFTAGIFCLILFSGASAQNAPPKEQNKREADLVELTKLSNSIKLDIRYATANNFVGRPVYPEARAFLQRPAAEALPQERYHPPDPAQPPDAAIHGRAASRSFTTDYGSV